MEEQDIRELRVESVVDTAWPTLGEDDTVEDAIKVFAERGVSGAPVVREGELVGIVTEGDLIFRDAEIKTPGFLDILGGIIPLGNWEEYREEILKSGGVTVDEVMTGDVTTIAPDETLSKAATIMAENRIKLLPVTDGDAYRGVVTRMDILTLHILKPRR